MQKFRKGLCLYFRGPNPTDCFFFIRVEIVRLDFIYLKTADPNLFFYCCAHEHTHTPYLIAPTLVLLSLLFITPQIDRLKRSKPFLEHLKLTP